MKHPIRTIAAIAALLACSATALADLADGLAIRYSFGSLGTDGQLADESGNGHTLKLGSALSLTNGPLPGTKAVRFDGTTGSWARFDGFALTNRTISFWVRLDAKNSSAINGVPYYFTDFGEFSLYCANGKENTTASTSFKLCGRTVGSALSFDRNVWRHHSFTVEFANNNCQVGSTFVMKHYVDGRLAYASGEMEVTARADKTTPAIVGNKDTDGTRALLGSMASFCVWSRALSAEEVTGLYFDEAKPAVPRLVAYWPLDEIDENDGVRTSPNMAECDFPTFSALAVEGESMVRTNGLFGNAVFAGSTACGRMRAGNGLEGGLSDWSCSFWMKAPCATSYNSTQRFIETSDSARMLTYMGQSNQQLLRWYLGYGREGKPYWNMPGALFCTNVWLHVAFVQSFEASGTNMLANFDLYVNGVKQSATYIQGASGQREIANAVDYVFWRDEADFRIGGRHATTPDTNDATVDEVAIFSGALTDGQVESLYRGSPEVDAGADFSTTGTTARLSGSVTRHKNSITVPIPGRYAWRLVSAPAGGDAASFPYGGSGLETTVTLPIEGTYVFELYCTDSLLPRKDRITVTRLAATGGNSVPSVTLAASAAVTLPAPLSLAPTVTDGDGDAVVVRWSKVSGPGGTWFDALADGSVRVTFGAAGTYVVRCTASDGKDETAADCTVTVSAAAQDIDMDLIHYWGLNTNRLSSAAVRDEITGTEISSAADYSWWEWPAKTFAAGVVGYAVQPDFGGTNFCWNTNTNLDETPTISGKANSRPTNQYVTLSAWVWVRPNDTNNVAGGIVVGQNQSWDVEFSHPDNPDSFSIMQQGDRYAADYTSYGSISYSILHFPAPSVPYAGRWAHIAAVLDRWGAEPNALYVDGVKQSHTSYEKFVTRAGRPNNAEITIGGRPWNVPPNNTWYNGNYPDASGNPISRCFPGIIDEVKIWKRKLSDAEIAYLAANPAPQNREPQIDAPARAVIRVGVGQATALVAPAVYDDGLPEGSSLSGAWEVVSGDVSAVSLDDGSITVSAEGEYAIRYAVTDGELTSYSDVVVVVAFNGGTVLMVR